MDADGATTTQTVFADLFEGSQYRTDIVPLAGQTMPDGLNGMLLTWATTTGTPGRTLTRVVPGGPQTDWPWSWNTSVLQVGQAGAVTLQGDGVLTVFDVTTGTTRWSVPSSDAPIAGKRPTNHVLKIVAKRRILAGVWGIRQSREVRRSEPTRWA